MEKHSNQDAEAEYPGPIDAVIAWVDGSDPAHARKRAKAMFDAGLSTHIPDIGTVETRFADCGEIYWCIASILKYAPFIRRIFVVTDAQEPDFLKDFATEGLVADDRIRVVDHTEVFGRYVDHLPTFNSLSIEAVIHRIDGLASNFIYFNDDFFLTAPTLPEDFIDAEGRVILHGRLRTIRWPLTKLYLRRLRRRIFADGHVPAHYKSATVLSAKIVGLKQYLQLEHIPHILRQRTLEDAYSAVPGLLARQVSYRFRHIDQILPVGLANHTEIARGTAQVRPAEKVNYMKPGPNGDIANNLSRIAKMENRFGCIQSFDEIFAEDPKSAARIVTVMDQVFGAHMPSTARAAMKDRFARADAAVSGG